MTTSVTLTQTDEPPELPVTGRQMIYARTDGVLYTMTSEGIPLTVWRGAEVFREADSLEDHSTQDMPITSIGARLMQDAEQPSISFRRFENNVNSGAGTKLWVPKQSRSLILKFASRIASPTSGYLLLHLNFRSFPDLNWHGTSFLVNQAASTAWRLWSLTFSLNSLLLTADTYQQISIVRKAEDAADTCETDWDVSGLTMEAP